MDEASNAGGNGRAAGPISEAMIRFFTEEKWPYMPLESEPILRVPFQGSNGQWLCYAQAREEQQQFVFYSVCPAMVPAELRPAMAEFVTRANYGLIIGNFELDYRDGELRYKTSLDVEGADLNSELLRSLVYANVAMMDHYLPGIMAVLYGNVSPEEAITQVEG
jgi:hypothetical protein